MPPRPMCSRCRSIEVRWEATSGRGRIWSFIVPHPPLLPGFTELAPYNVVLVELDEDATIRVTGQLVGRVGDAPSAIDPATIVIGEPVCAVFHRVEDVGFLQWMRANS